MARWRRWVLGALGVCLAAASAGCTLLPVRGRQIVRTMQGEPDAAPAVGTDAFAAALDRAAGGAAHPGTRAKLLQNGDEAYPVMLRLIESARERISLETYIVDKDEITDRFFDALRDAARRGVEVRLLVDAAGYDRGMIVDLRDMNMPHLEARPFNPFFLSWTLLRGNNRDHRKILVVDGEYAVMGGINLSHEQLGDGITGWRDTALLATGPVAADAERIFAETWEQAGRGWIGKTTPIRLLNPLKLALEQPLRRGRFVPPPYRAPEGEAVFADDFYDTLSASVWAVASSPEGWESPTHDAALAGIRGARERIDAAYAYFVPPMAMRRALAAAARRGVRVRLLLPGVTDVTLVREMGMRSYDELLAAGVELYEWPHPILHAKTMAVDGRWLMVGSANMDCRSYFLNYEALFAVDDGPLAEAAHRRFEADLREARPLTLDEWRARPLKQRLVERALTPLSGQY